ncbi:hypothetical protein [Corynebacterium sp.]|uniref:hypothetical protein n=1 Tax=Corynebacterium sp. TaxID=1720 RepID=UPI0028AFF9E2|nr:hypothetical protein [Corynebacterium sp.]
MNSNDSEKERMRQLLLAVKAQNDATFKVWQSSRHVLDQAAARNEDTLSKAAGRPEVVEKVMQALSSSGDAEEGMQSTRESYETAQASWEKARAAFVEEYGEEL